MPRGLTSVPNPPAWLREGSVPAERVLSPAFEALLQNSSDVISLVDHSGSVLFSSAASMKVLGYSPAELVGQDALELIHPADRMHARRSFRRVLLRSRSSRQFQVRMRHKRGHWCWVENTITNLILEPKLMGILVNCREISLRQAAHESQKQAEAASRTKLDHFVYAVAHDLMEPLRTISMMTELLVRDTPLQPRGAQAAGFVVEGVARMTKALADLRKSATSVGAEVPEILDLGLAAAGAVQNLGHAIGIADAVISIDPLPWVVANHQQMIRLFQNLLANAIKYRSERPVEIMVTAEAAGLDWIVKVRDNGKGIAPQDQEVVFNYLSRVNSANIPGAGIGLTTCRQIIHEMGGRIWVEATLGAGSDFCFLLPSAVIAGQPILLRKETTETYGN